LRVEGDQLYLCDLCRRRADHVRRLLDHRVRREEHDLEDAARRAPDLSNPSNPDFLTSLYQTVDGIQRASGGFHMCSDRPAETVSSGTPSLMWHGNDGVFNTACGALLQ
jgi:hypothetical protein